MRAKLLREEQSLTDYAWSSYPGYLLPPAKRPVWLRVDGLRGEFGIRLDDAAGRLRQETVMTLDWIADLLKTGCRHTLANCFKAARVANSPD